MTSPAFTQISFRLRNDNGSETTATWKQNENVNDTITANANFRVRFRIDETNSRAWTNKNWNLYYDLNGAGYLAVTDSTPIQFSLSDNFADGDDCTAQLTGGTGTFVTNNNGMKETTGGATNSGSAGYLFELEWCLKIDAAQVADGDTIALRVRDGSSTLALYSNTPTITVNDVITILLDTAVITATGRAITVDAPVPSTTIVLDTASITATGQVLTVQNIPLPTIIVLDTAVLTASGQAITVLKGAKTIALDTATITAVGRAVTVLKGARTIQLDTATITVDGKSITIQKGAITIQLDTAVVTAVGQVFVVLKGAITIQLDTALLTANGQTITVSSGAAEIIIQLDTAILTASGQTLDVIPGAVSLLLDTAVLTADGQAITIDEGIAPTIIQLSTAVITAVGQALDVIPGAKIIQLNTAVLNVDGQSIIVHSGISPTVINLNTAILTANGITLDVMPGPRTILLDTATITANGQHLTVITISSIVIMLDTAVLTATGQSLDVLPGSVSISLDTAVLNCSADTIDIVSGAVTISLDTATLVATGQHIQISIPPGVHPVWFTGFEYGVLSTYGGMFALISAGATVQTLAKHSGNYALRIYRTTAAVCVVTRNLSPTRILIGSFYFYWHTAPSAVTTINYAILSAGLPALIYFDPTDKTLYAYQGNAGAKTTALNADTWYRIDYKFDTSKNPNTIDLQLEGVPVAQHSYAQAASNMNLLGMGLGENRTGELFFDDYMISYTLSDYPIGNHKIVKLSPLGDGISNPLGVMQDNAGVLVDDITNPAYVELDDYPLGGSTDYIKQIGINIAAYAEVAFEHISESLILGTMAILAYRSNAASPVNNGKTYIKDTNGQLTLVYSGDMSEVALFYKSILVLRPTTNWSMTMVNGLLGQVGFSSNVATVPYWHALLLEIAYVPVYDLERLFKGMYKDMLKGMR